ncbi:MAG: 50S ribosomal protein L29 [Candidatus Wildermuthbacteria bacterium]|nr:50S ribosomal protein L29 [Candidatus Wildermuthbacteria bacterium]
MNIQELRKQSARDFQRILQEERARVRQLRFDIAAGKTKQTKDLRDAKKTIARILSIINERKTPS